jgi:hypothetical protein
VNSETAPQNSRGSKVAVNDGQLYTNNTLPKSKQKSAQYVEIRGDPRKSATTQPPRISELLYQINNPQACESKARSTRSKAIDGVRDETDVPHNCQKQHDCRFR